MSELIWCLFVAWYIFCGFSFGRTVRLGGTIFSVNAPFGLSVVLWSVLMPVDGLFKEGK